jgi:acyl-CoA synthetase (AMP-forming)/AMP-acid ligase II
MLTYSCGPDHQLSEHTIGEVLDRTVSRFSDRLALVSCHQSRHYTWWELRDAGDAVARGLASLGVGRGDRVGLWSTNCAEWVLVERRRASLLLGWRPLPIGRPIGAYSSRILSVSFPRYEPGAFASRHRR